MTDFEPDNTRENRGESRWKPGESGNPKGRPKGSRNKLGEDFLKMLAADFEEHGSAVIEKVRETKPEVYLRVVADLLPRDFKIGGKLQFEHENILPEERRARILELLERGGYIADTLATC
jgi:hypothetical protein